jgi:hypothetical protein
VNANVNVKPENLDKYNHQDIEKALSDPAAFREIEDKVSKANQELGVTQRSQTDILSENIDYLFFVNLLYYDRRGRKKSSNRLSFIYWSSFNIKGSNVFLEYEFLFIERYSFEGHFIFSKS